MVYICSAAETNGLKNATFALLTLGIISACLGANQAFSSKPPHTGNQVAAGQLKKSREIIIIKIYTDCK